MTHSFKVGQRVTLIQPISLIDDGTPDKVHVGDHGTVEHTSGIYVPWAIVVRFDSDKASQYEIAAEQVTEYMP